MPKIAHTLKQRKNETYGLIPENFQFDLQIGYSVLAGRNNEGKSTVLQFIFKSLVGTSEVSNNDFCIINQDRQYILPTTQPPTTLMQFNNDLFEVCNNSPKSSEGIRGQNPHFLYTALLHRSNFTDQMKKVNELLIRLGFDPIVLKEAQIVKINDIDIHLQGSGIRCVLPILCALTSPDIKIVVIDEPELSLEARSQKVLKEILFEAVNEGKTIVVATQSHLFLHKTEPEKNYEVTKNANKLSVKRLSEKEHILDLTYNLLGNSLEDLFFPSNFLIVEGVSDQIICEKVAKLLEVSAEKVKPISARGIDNISDAYKSIENTLVPLLVEYSPYSKKVVVLTDKPETEAHEKRLAEIKKHLRNRCFTLTKHSLEEYIQSGIYSKAGRDKSADLKQIEEINNEIKYGGKDGIRKLWSIKKEISTAIAECLTVADLSKIKIIKEAVELAAKKA